MSKGWVRSDTNLRLQTGCSLSLWIGRAPPPSRDASRYLEVPPLRVAGLHAVRVPGSVTSRAQHDKAHPIVQRYALSFHALTCALLKALG